MGTHSSKGQLTDTAAGRRPPSLSDTGCVVKSRTWGEIRDSAEERQSKQAGQAAATEGRVCAHTHTRHPAPREDGSPSVPGLMERVRQRDN